MRVIYFSILLLLIVPGNLFSQMGPKPKVQPVSKDFLKPKYQNITGNGRAFTTVRWGYIWEGYNNIELSMSRVFLNKKRDILGSLTFSCDFFKHYVTYATPVLGLRTFFQFVVIWELSCNYSCTRVNHISDQRVSPELGFRIGNAVISYGYNIPVNKEQVPFVSNHKIALKFGI